MAVFNSATRASTASKPTSSCVAAVGWAGSWAGSAKLIFAAALDGNRAKVQKSRFLENFSSTSSRPSKPQPKITIGLFSFGVSDGKAAHALRESPRSLAKSRSQGAGVSLVPVPTCQGSVRPFLRHASCLPPPLHPRRFAVRCASHSRSDCFNCSGAQGQ